MDLGSQRGSILPARTPFRPRAARYLPCPPLPTIRKSGREFEKDVKIVRANPASHLESIEVARNELKTDSKRTSNEAENRAVKTRNRPNKANPHSFPLGQPMPRDLEPSRKFKKNVKIVGTNSITRLESIEVAKSELKTNSKRTPNEAENRV
jgi:hypothetical protein